MTVLKAYNEQRLTRIYTVQEWMQKRTDEDGTITINNDYGLSQAMFARDCLHPPLDNSGEARKHFPLMVVSEHTSKSKRLPVIKMHNPRRQIEVWWRNNFYNWKFSVRSHRPVPDVFYRLFQRDDEINAVYCEGFDESWVFGSYAANQQEFTVEVPSSLYLTDWGNCMAFAFCLLLGEVTR